MHRVGHDHLNRSGSQHVAGQRQMQRVVFQTRFDLRQRDHDEIDPAVFSLKPHVLSGLGISRNDYLMLTDYDPLTGHHSVALRTESRLRCRRFLHKVAERSLHRHHPGQPSGVTQLRRTDFTAIEVNGDGTFPVDRKTAYGSLVGNDLPFVGSVPATDAQAVTGCFLKTGKDAPGIHVNVGRAYRVVRAMTGRIITDNLHLPVGAPTDITVRWQIQDPSEGLHPHPFRRTSVDGCDGAVTVAGDNL